MLPHTVAVAECSEQPKESVLPQQLYAAFIASKVLAISNWPGRPQTFDELSFCQLLQCMPPH
jgi:hypothetical protein